MDLKEEIISCGQSLEEACNMFGLDAETLIMCQNNPKLVNDWVINTISRILELDAEDIN